MPDLGSIWLEAAGQEKRAQAASAELKQRAVETQQRAQQEQQRLQIQQQESTRQAQLEQTRLQVNTQIQQQQLDLQQQRIKAAADAAKQKAAAAASAIADQRSFATDLANGMPVKDALYRHPRLATPAAVSKANEDAERIKQHRDEMAARQLHADNAELDKREKEENEQQFKTKQAETAAKRFAETDADRKASLAERKREFNISNRIEEPAPAVPIPASKNANEVIRHTKEGRGVVYDATTKKPLRFASKEESEAQSN